MWFGYDRCYGGEASATVSLSICFGLYFNGMVADVFLMLRMMPLLESCRSVEFTSTANSKQKRRMGNGNRHKAQPNSYDVGVGVCCFST